MQFEEPFAHPIKCTVKEWRGGSRGWRSGFGAVGFLINKQTEHKGGSIVITCICLYVREGIDLGCCCFYMDLWVGMNWEVRMRRFFVLVSEERNICTPFDHQDDLVLHIFIILYMLYWILNRGDVSNRWVEMINIHIFTILEKKHHVVCIYRVKKSRYMTT